MVKIEYLPLAPPMHLSQTKAARYYKGPRNFRMGTKVNRREGLLRTYNYFKLSKEEWYKQPKEFGSDII
ncbi:MAG: hypothetical protein M9959_14100 [Chitinophagaceae bacterium]|nr:hypothetical protein [Chitinophagaceae bacterium]